MSSSDMPPSKIPLFSVVDIIHLSIDFTEVLESAKSANLLKCRKLCLSFAYGESRSLIISRIVIHINNNPLDNWELGTFTSTVNDELFRRQREGTLWEITKLNRMPTFWRENIGSVHKLTISRTGDTVKRYEDLGLDLRRVHTLGFFTCTHLSDLSGLIGSSIHKITIYYGQALKNLKGLEGIHTVTLYGASYDLTGLGKNHSISFFSCDKLRNTEAVSCSHSLEIQWTYDYSEESGVTQAGVTQARDTFIRKPSTLDFSKFKEVRNITIDEREVMMYRGIEELRHLQYVRINQVGGHCIIEGADISVPRRGST